MRKRFAVMYGLEGGNFTSENKEEVNAVPETEVIPDNSGATDVTNTPETVVEEATDNSSTVVIDTQEESVKPDLVPKKQLVFLGGTCNESTWREKLIDGLKMAYFNPVVQDWKEDDKEKEDQIKNSADFNLFVFTPKHTGYFSFVEASLLAVKSSSRTILCVLQDDDGVTFEEDKKRSIDAIVAELDKEGIKTFNNLDDVRAYLNGKEDPNGEQEAPVSEETSEAMTTPPAEETPVVETPVVDENKDSAELSTANAEVTVKVDTESAKDENGEDKDDK